MSEPLELFAWGPAFDLPSWDPGCLAVQAYLQFAGADWVVSHCSSASVSPTGELPMLRDGIRPIAGSAYIISYLKKKGLDLDTHLSPTEAAECLSYSSLIEDKLYDALLFNRWLDAENFARSTRPMMAKTLPWVTRYHVPTQLRQKAQSRLKRYRIMLDVDGEAVNEVYLMARDIFKSLAAKLGDKPFFMGTHPTSLDAIAFGHLSMHAIPSLKNPRLFSILTFEFPTLIAYCDRVQKSLFATPPKLSPNIRPVSFLSDVVQRPSHYAREAWTVVARWGAKFTSEPSNGGGSGVETGADGASGATDKEKKKSSESEELVRAERREAFYRLLSAVSAVAAFGAYVAYQGIIRIETVDGDVGEEEEAA